jgi:hypothetical protein
MLDFGCGVGAADAVLPPSLSLAAAAAEEEEAAEDEPEADGGAAAAGELVAENGGIGTPTSPFVSTLP